MLLAVTEAPLLGLAPFEMNPSTKVEVKTTYPTTKMTKVATISIILKIKASRVRRIEQSNCYHYRTWGSHLRCFRRFLGFRSAPDKFSYHDINEAYYERSVCMVSPMRAFCASLALRLLLPPHFDRVATAFAVLHLFTCAPTPYKGYQHTSTTKASHIAMQQCTVPGAPMEGRYW